MFVQQQKKRKSSHGVKLCRTTWYNNIIIWKKKEFCQNSYEYWTRTKWKEWSSILHHKICILCFVWNRNKNLKYRTDDGQIRHLNWNETTIPEISPKKNPIKIDQRIAHNIKMFFKCQQQEAFYNKFCLLFFTNCQYLHYLYSSTHSIFSTPL